MMRHLTARHLLLCDCNDADFDCEGLAKPVGSLTGLCLFVTARTLRTAFTINLSILFRVINWNTTRGYHRFSIDRNFSINTF